MKIIGHRGAKALAPENTLASFKKALEHNVDEIECDAHVTVDGVVVLVHDAVMHDAAGRVYKVTEHTYVDLLRHKPDLTTLEEALILINRSVPFMIEVKPGVDIEPILAVIKKMRTQGWINDDITIASESFTTLKAIREQMPELTLSLVDGWSGVRASWRAKKLGITRLSMNYRVLWGGFIRGMANRGYQISAYTVNSRRAAERLERAGLHAVFTDTPDLLTKSNK